MKRLALMALSLAALACVQACSEEALEPLMRKTPLHEAAEAGKDLAEIRQLIEDGADVNSRDFGDRTPLHYAAHFNPEPSIVEALIEAGADVNAMDDFGATPLAYAMMGVEMYGAAVGREEPSIPVIEALLAAGADANAHGDDFYGMPPIHHAVSSGKPDIVEMLIAAGADVNAYDGYYGMAPLHSAAMSSEEPGIVRALLAAGADVDAESKEPSAELQAELESFIWVIDMLVMLGVFEEGGDDGVNVTGFWLEGRTPLLFALRGNENTSIPVVKELIAAGADVNVRDKDGLTPLLIARQKGMSPHIMEALVDAGADVNAEPLDLGRAAGGGEAPDASFEWYERPYLLLWLVVAAILLLALFMMWRRFRTPAKGEADPGA